MRHQGARVFEEAGFPALATPSAGIAACLGYEDGATPAEEMFAAVTRIVRSVSVPVSADIESGYGLAPRELVARVLDTGAVGVNLEDSEHGTLKDPRRHADWLAEVRAEAGDRLFLNARVDTFVRGSADPVTEAAARARLYVAAGADCVYPILAPAVALPRLRAAIDGPLNAHADVAGASVRALAEAGATRITFGPGLQRAAPRGPGCPSACPRVQPLRVSTSSNSPAINSAALTRASRRAKQPATARIALPNALPHAYSAIVASTTITS